MKAGDYSKDKEGDSKDDGAAGYSSFERMRRPLSKLKISVSLPDVDSEINTDGSNSLPLYPVSRNVLTRSKTVEASSSYDIKQRRGSLSSQSSAVSYLSRRRLPERMRSIPYFNSSARKVIKPAAEDVFGSHKVVPQSPDTQLDTLTFAFNEQTFAGRNYGSLISSQIERVDLPLVDSRQSTPRSLTADRNNHKLINNSILRGPIASCFSFFRRIFRRDNVALLVVSISATILFILLDQAWISLQSLWLMKEENGEAKVRLSGFFIRTCLVLGSVVVTEYIAPEGAGSGIPQLKAVLAGEVKMSSFLSFRLLVGKSVATMLALGAGIPIGREGPFIHLAAAVAAQTRRHAFKNAISKRRLLCAGAAVGIAACMGSAIGGTLFSIEVTSITFVVSHYWSTFSSAIIAFVTNTGIQRVRRTTTKRKAYFTYLWMMFFPASR